MTRRLKLIPALVAAAGILTGAFAQGSVPMQTVQDSAKGNRLIINGKPVFISGMNIAWNNFARDVGDGQVAINSFVNQFKQIKGAGGNAVRWWLHTDAQADPKFNESTGAVTGLGTRTISNIRQVLDSAYNYGIVVSLCLFSFDILHNDGNNKTSAQMARNLKFMTEPANLDTYITNALRPMLDAVGSHPAIMCWEVFNEPEGMTKEHGWSTEKIDHSHIMRFTNKIAGEVHRRTKKMASTGIHNFSQGERTRYSDAKLREAGGDQDGYLDFYMAHYYPQYGGTSESPFHHPASYWGFDRPVLIGEFPAQSWGPGTGYNMALSGTAMTITAAYEYAYNNGYCGAMSWSMTEGDKAKFGSFETTKPALENLYAKHKADIDIKDVVIVVPTGDLAMKLSFNALATGDANEVLVKKEASSSLAGKNNLTFDLYIDQQSGSSLQAYLAIQTGESDNWGWYDVQVNLNSYSKGTWVTVQLPISSFSGLSSSANIYALFFKFVASGTPYTGTVYIDNVKIDNTVISNFNELASEWSVAGGEVSVSLAQRPGGTSSVRGAVSTSGISRAPAVTVLGKTLHVKSATGANTQVRLVSVSGKTAAKFSAAGDARFSLDKVPAGRYIVETKIAGKRAGSSAIVVK
ncbi:MAG: hypothetical protein FWB85_08680 [Chitinispirillia bacterium]|nr:hypothetical protein [Chitinispirillia bacterium]MCL2242385.1 hypothetical protein [Chitinispirillia bacterium]